MEGTNATEGNTMNLSTYQISHFDYAQGKRVVDGHISATDIYAAKHSYWHTNHSDYDTCMVARRNELHLTGGTKYTFTKIS